MFRRFKASPATSATNNYNGHRDNNHNMTNNPNGTPPGQGGPTQGFVLSKWLRLHLVDLITMAAMGAVGLGVYRARKMVLP